MPWPWKQRSKVVTLVGSNKLATAVSLQRSVRLYFLLGLPSVVLLEVAASFRHSTRGLFDFHSSSVLCLAGVLQTRQRSSIRLWHKSCGLAAGEVNSEGSSWTFRKWSIELFSSSTYLAGFLCVSDTCGADGNAIVFDH